MMETDDMKSIGKWISALYREFQVYINSEVKELGISSSEYIYPVSLCNKEGGNLRNLSDELMINQAETTRIMKRLEENGLVTRERCEHDRRAINVSLTEEGRELQPHIFEKLDVWTNLLSTGMEEDEVRDFIMRLKGMYSHCRNYLKFETAVFWNYTVISGRIFQISRENPLFSFVQTSSVEENPWEMAFFTHENIEMFHIQAQEVICPEKILSTADTAGRAFGRGA